MFVQLGGQHMSNVDKRYLLNYNHFTSEWEVLLCPMGVLLPWQQDSALSKYVYALEVEYRGFKYLLKVILICKLAHYKDVCYDSKCK